jgi:hypothetical protein
MEMVSDGVDGAIGDRLCTEANREERALTTIAPISSGLNSNTFVPTSCNAIGTYPVASTLKNEPAPRRKRLKSHLVVPLAASILRFGRKILSDERKWRFGREASLCSGAMYGRKRAPKIVQKQRKQNASWKGARGPMWE